MTTKFKVTTATDTLKEAIETFNANIETGCDVECPRRWLPFISRALTEAGIAHTEVSDVSEDPALLSLASNPARLAKREECR